MDFQLEAFKDSPKITSRLKFVNPMVIKYGPGPLDKRCKDCDCIGLGGTAHVGRYYKCRYRGNTSGPGTDHRVNWETCSKFNHHKKEGKEPTMPKEDEIKKDCERKARFPRDLGACWSRIKELEKENAELKKNKNFWELAKVDGERIKELKKQVEVGKKAGEILNNCILLDKGVYSNLQEVYNLCRIQAQRNGLVLPNIIEITKAETEKNGESRTENRSVEHIVKSNLQGISNLLKLGLEDFCRKLSTGEKSKSQDNAKDAKLSLNQDSYTDTTTIIQNLTWLSGYVLLAMDLSIGNTNEAITQCRGTGLI
jgi:hypothetical protein